MAETIQTRAFLVGCPRSGTTLLQSMLYAHPNIYSLPETSFFDDLIGIYKRSFLRESPKTLNGKLRALARDTLVKFNLVERTRQRKAWCTLREAAVCRGLGIPVGSKSFLITHQAAAFVRAMDMLAQTSNKPIWLEKSPGHLYLIPEITSLVPEARFVHIIRDGKANVASLYDSARKYPDEHWEHYTNIETAVRVWNIALQEARKYRNDPAHYFVRYEHLTVDPRETLSRLCKFLGCNFDERMITDQASAASELIKPHEHWKSGNRRVLVGAAPSKYSQLFDADQRTYIEKALLPLGELFNLPQWADIETTLLPLAELFNTAPRSYIEAAIFPFA